jgi:hypothetical protein
MDPHVWMCDFRPRFVIKGTMLKHENRRYVVAKFKSKFEAIQYDLGYHQTYFSNTAYFQKMIG